MVKKSFPACIIISLTLFFVFTSFILLSAQSFGLSSAVKISWAFVISGIAFLIFYTGKIYPYRAAFFIITAWAFVVNFRGIFLFAESSSDVPYCHIAQCSTILNIFRNIYLAFASGEPAAWLPLSLGILWLVVTLLLGQAFC